MTAWPTPLRLPLAGLLLALLTACATPPRDADLADGNVWQGRLALQVDGQPPQSLSAGFELRGDPQVGELALSSPLGQVLAVADWGPAGARLRQGGSERRFASVDDMTTELTGTALPLAALFAWLRGQADAPPGWEVDLSAHAEGRLVARRLAPPPQAELRLRFATP